MSLNGSGKLALITGASAGIGMELAKLHASNGGDLVLVARRIEKLEALKEELESAYGIAVHIIPKDMGLRESPGEIAAELDKKNLNLDYLVNNAGFSVQGYFHEIDWSRQETMVMVHVLGMMELTYLLLPGMIKRNSGKILNVASSAAFAPGGPLQTVYYATKAFIVSFSQGLAGELAETGITVTALCPGATATEFEKVSGLDQTELFSMEKVFTAAEVARDGYEAMLRGDLVKLTALTPVNKFVLRNMNLFPSKRILQQVRLRQEKKK